MNSVSTKSSKPTMRILHHFEDEEVVTYNGDRLRIGKPCPIFKRNTHVYATNVNTGRQCIISRGVPLRKGLRWFIPEDDYEVSRP